MEGSHHSETSPGPSAGSAASSHDRFMSSPKDEPLQHEFDQQAHMLENIKREIYAQHPGTSSGSQQPALVTVVTSDGHFLPNSGNSSLAGIKSEQVAFTPTTDLSLVTAANLTSLGGALSLFPSQQGITQAQVDTPDGPVRVLLVPRSNGLPVKSDVGRSTDPFRLEFGRWKRGCDGVESGYRPRGHGQWLTGNLSGDE